MMDLLKIYHIFYAITSHDPSEIVLFLRNETFLRW